MRKSMIKLSLWFVCVVLLIGAFILLPTTQTKAETLVESSLFFRIYVAFSVDQNAVQEWIPSPWKAVSLPKGPFKGANLFVIFDDRFICQDAEGKPYRGGAFHNAVLAAYGKNPQTEEVAVFVIRVYWPHDDLGAYKNAVKAKVQRESTLKGENLEPGVGSEKWKVVDSSWRVLEFSMDYQRAVSQRTKRESKARSSVEPDFFRIYRDDFASDLVKSVPSEVDRVKNYQFRSTISELGKMFNGSEQLVGILVNPCRVRQVFLPAPTEVYYDEKMGLEWLAGADKPTSWNDAKKWVLSLQDYAGGGWRMPTLEELRTLYQKGEKCHIRPSLKTTGCWIWSGETKGSSLAWGYDYHFEPGSSIISGGSGSSTGTATLKRDESTDDTRGFAVRIRK